MNKFLFIFRGVPGCGKSTLGEVLSEGKYPVCTADDYFMENGQYKFDPNKLHFAHKSCQNKCENSMQMGVEKVFVANTATTEKELKPYYDLAEKYGYLVFSLVIENRHGGKNEHNVPEEKVKQMEERLKSSIKLT